MSNQVSNPSRTIQFSPTRRAPGLRALDRASASLDRSASPAYLHAGTSGCGVPFRDSGSFMRRPVALKEPKNREIHAQRAPGSASRSANGYGSKLPTTAKPTRCTGTVPPAGSVPPEGAEQLSCLSSRFFEFPRHFVPQHRIEDR